MRRGVFVPRQLVHKASGMVFNANPQLEMSADYEEYAPAHIMYPDDPPVVKKRRGRPPKEARDGDDQ